MGHKKKSLLIAIVCLFAGGCGPAGPGGRSGVHATCTVESTPPSFSADVQPLLSTNCSGCHGSAFSTYSGATSSAFSIESSVQSGSMPPGGLNSTDRDTIVQWVACGQNP